MQGGSWPPELCSLCKQVVHEWAQINDKIVGANCCYEKEMAKAMTFKARVRRARNGLGQRDT
jgi:hypothetical protein